MARDVELVIKARDAATKAIDGIKDALKDLTDVQTDVGRSAERTDTLLGELGRQLRTLNGEAKGLAALGKVAGELDRAGAAVSRLERDVEKSVSEFGRLARETQDAAANTARLRGEVEAERRSIEENTASRRAASKELTQANKAVREAERNQARLNATIAKQPETKVGSAAWSASVFAAADLDSARARQSSATVDVAAYATAIDRSKQALKALEPQAASAAAQEQKLSAATAKTAGALERQRGSLTTARTELAGMSVAADQASRGLLGTALDAGKLADASNRTAGEIAKTESRLASMRRIPDVFGGIADGSRRASAGFADLRASLVSTVAGFASLYAAADQIGRVLNSFQAIEGVQARLGVVFQGDAGRIGAELQFLQREAQRLGVSFGQLGGQYSKFAIASNAANFSSKATRDIFLSVAEAARVNRLSAEELDGVFLALTQMISKGKVSAEELRGQLGERLPGAFNIFADAIGVSTAELDKMLEQGQVFATQGTLLKFADQLTKRFGPQLAESLRGTTAEIGRFSDNVFQAQARVAEGGFIDSFTKGLRSLNEQFQSREGRDFFLSIGAALGNLTSVLAAVPRYFGEIGLAVKILIGLKLGAWFSSAVRSIGELRAAVVGIGGTATVTAGAFRALWSAIGGVPGIIFSGITVALGAWVTRVDETVSALDEHRRIMGLVLAQYDAVTDKAKAWADGIKGVTVTEAETSVRKLGEAYDSQFDTLRDRAQGVLATIQRFQGPLGAINREMTAKALGEPTVRAFENIAKAIDDVGRRSITVEDFRRTLDGIAQGATDGSLKGLAADLIEASKAAGENGQTLETLGTAITQAQAVLRGLKGDADDSTDAVLRGAAGAEKAGGAFDAAAKEGMKAFNDALQDISKSIPSVGDELKRLDAINALDKQYQTAVKLAQSMGDIMRLTEAYNAAVQGVNLQAFGGANLGSAVNQIKQYEGFTPDSKWDVNHFRVGYGSDTVTLADGSIKKVIDGITITEADAMRDLVRRVGEFQGGVKKQIGADRFGAFSDSQQGVLTSIAYNYGSLPDRIVDAVKTGNADIITDAIRGLGSDNDGINRNRRNKEADTFAADGDTPKSAAILAERNSKAKEYNDALNTRLSLQAQENANGGRLTEEAFVQKQLAEEQNRAREADVTLSTQQVATIKALAAEEYRVADAKRDGKTAQQEANVALQQAVALAAQRNELQKRFDLAQKAGDVTRATDLQSQLEGVNGKLGEAIEKARSMWTEIGGPAADVAITKLDTLKLKAEQTGNRISFLGISTQQIGQLVGSFADGFAGVFDTFAQSIASGENAVKSLGKAFLQFAADFLREIAQMIIKAQALALVKSIAGGLGLPIPLAHTGGVMGSVGAGLGNGKRLLMPEVFLGATRYHSGGVAGLRPDEVPAVLKKNEEVITEQDPRHRFNGGRSKEKGSSGPMSIKNVLVLDDESALGHLQSPAGERVLLTHIKRNAATIKRMLG